MNDKCGATYELMNGESVTPCDLPKGHEGDHMGYCLGSRCCWEQGQESEWEDIALDRDEAEAVDRGDDAYDYESSTRDIIEADIRDRWIGKMEEDGFEESTT